MKRVTPKSAGVKLNGKWCFKNQEAVISEEEYNLKKAFVDVLEDIRESNERVIEVVVTDETIDIEELKKDIDNYVKNYKKVPEFNSAENVDNAEPSADKNTDDNTGDNNGDNSDEELEALKEKAKGLGIKNVHNMKKETLIAKIEEAEAGENQNPDGE